MNSLLATSAIRLTGATVAKPTVVSPAITNRVAFSGIDRAVLTTAPVGPASLPLLHSQIGNLFADRNDAKLRWYLPDFSLDADVDPSFAFAASQSGQDANGNPFNTARLTLRIHKSQPDDVASFMKTNPGMTLREIPLLDLSTVLTSFYIGDDGQTKQRTANGAIQDSGNGDFLLTFENQILGPFVIGLYQDLTSFGKAAITLSASFQAWLGSSAGTTNMPRTMMLSTVAMHSMSMAPATPVRSFAPQSLQRVNTTSNNPAANTLVQTRSPWAKQLPLGVKYKQDGYQLKYTVSTTSMPNHIILGPADLHDFGKAQSEFTELKALGDISQKYPSLSGAYIGVLSRSIVVIPRRYSIVRSSLGCAAVCMALVDSSAANGSKCKFEFDFSVAPDVSRIEFLELAQEIATRTDLLGYQLKLPDFLDDNPSSTLQTAFASNVQFSAGADPHTFAVSISIHDDGLQTPAVANANLLIMRLCSDSGADLLGSISLKLDDGYAGAVLSTLVLNFAHTAGTDELAVQMDETTMQLTLTNQSPLDLQLSRYALIQGSAMSLVLDAPSLPAGATFSIPLPAQHSGLLFAADAQLTIPKPLTKSDTAKFLHFQTADVQETQYFIAIDGSGIDFKKVDSVVANITFSTLPNIAPRPLSLNKDVLANNTQIVIPLENAVFSLPGTVALKIHFIDPGIQDLLFTMQNEFTADPVLIILQSDIDKNLSAHQ